MRTKAKFISCSVVNDMWCGRLTGMSARETRTSAIVRSLGIGSFVVRLRAAGREAAGVEERQVHRRLAVDDPVGDVTSGGGRVLEAVPAEADGEDRKSTRLNSSHGYISYAVFCLKKKKN